MEIPEEPGFWAIVIGWGATLAIWFFRGGRKYEQTSAALENHEGRIKTLESESINHDEHKMMQETRQANIGASVDSKLHIMQTSLHREIADVKEITCKILGKIEGMNK